MSCLCHCTHPFLNLLEHLIDDPDPRPHLDDIAELIDGLCAPEDDDSFRWRHDKVTHLDALEGVVWREIPVTVPRRDGTSHQGLVPEVEYAAVQLAARGASAARVVEVYRELCGEAVVVAHGECHADA